MNLAAATVPAVLADLPVSPCPITGCWWWTRGYMGNGYGRAWWKKRSTPAHRMAYEIRWGPIPPGVHVLHRCDQPACVNPDHLFLGTHRDNMMDAIAKGRHPADNLRRGTAALVAMHTAVTACPRGHPYTPENTQWNRNKRSCRACKRLRGRG